MKKTRQSIFRDIYYQPYNEFTRAKLYTSSKESLQLIQRMSLLKRLKVHNGCVNSICWNKTGDMILSGGDDQHLVLTNTYNYKVITDYNTSHRANIFSAKFLPNSGDQRIVSCSGDGTILYTDLSRRSETFYNQFDCHTGTTYDIATLPDEPHTFLSCGEDRTVRKFDLRIKDKCYAPSCTEDILISCQRAVTAFAINPASPYQIAIGCSDSTVSIYDTRKLGTVAIRWLDTADKATPLSIFTVPEFGDKSYRITSLSYSPDGRDVLVSYSSDNIYLFSVKDKGSMHLRKDVQGVKGKGKTGRVNQVQQVRRLRLRGDWSDTGPDARPECEGGRRSGTEIAQARPVLQTSLMQRMTEVLIRMLNDPATRAALSGRGEDGLEDLINRQENPQTDNEIAAQATEETNNASERTTADTQLENDTRVVESQTERLDAVSETPSEPASSSQEEFERCQPPKQSTSIDTTTDESRLEDKSKVPLESESSRSEPQKCTMRPTTSNCTNESNDEDRSSDEASSASMDTNQDGHMMENLQDRLTTMRDGFLERHGSEPAVSLTYSSKSSSNGTISLGVANEVIRDTYHPGPSGSSSTSGSHDKHTRYVPKKNHENVFTDSDDEDITPRRLIYPLKLEVDRDHEPETLNDDSLPEVYVKQKYMGHRNARTMIKEANFWGNDYVMSGSDCGHVFVWERDTARLCMLLEADQHVVNCVQPHPFLPMLATAGVDYDVKLWAPINEECSFDEKFAEDLKKRNEVMLEETKHTVTVPAVFMIRMLSCLNQIRRGRVRNRRRNGDENGGSRHG